MIPFIQNIKEVFYELKNELKIKNSINLKVSLLILFYHIAVEFNDLNNPTIFRKILIIIIVVVIDFGVFFYLYNFINYNLNKISFKKDYNNEISYNNIKKIYNKIESELNEKKVEIVYEFSYISFIFIILVYIIFK